MRFFPCPATGVLVAIALCATAGCGTLRLKKAVPAQQMRIERLTVAGQYPTGSDRFEAWAMINGYQTGSDSKLLPPRQWMDGYRVHLEQMEQPAENYDENPPLIPFQRSLPIDVSELAPGFYIVNVNGFEKRLEIPQPPAEGMSAPVSQATETAPRPPAP